MTAIYHWLCAVQLGAGRYPLRHATGYSLVCGDLNGTGHGRTHTTVLHRQQAGNGAATGGYETSEVVHKRVNRSTQLELTGDTVLELGRVQASVEGHAAGTLDG